MNNSTTNTWDIEISPKRSLLNIKEIWSYRDLLTLLVKRDVISFYKQTILGPVWFFIQPVFTTIIFTFIFGNLAGISTDGLPQPLFYMAGITTWNYFADCLLKTSTVFKDNASIFGKVYFPRLIVPLSIVISNLIRFGIQLLLLIAVMVYYSDDSNNIGPNTYLLLFPLIVVIMAALGLGMGLIISAMTAKYRDLAFLVTFGVQLMMYTTTVIYPLSAAFAKYPEYAWIIRYNPMTVVIETFRWGLMGSGSFSWSDLVLCTAITILIAGLGMIIFNRAEKNFVDTV